MLADVEQKSLLNYPRLTTIESGVRGLSRDERSAVARAKEYILNYLEEKKLSISYIEEIEVDPYRLEFIVHVTVVFSGSERKRRYMVKVHKNGLVTHQR